MVPFRERNMHARDSTTAGASRQRVVPKPARGRVGSAWPDLPLELVALVSRLRAEIPRVDRLLGELNAERHPELAKSLDQLSTAALVAVVEIARARQPKREPHCHGGAP